MKPKDILIAAATILLISGLLSGCSLVEKNENKPVTETAGPAEETLPVSETVRQMIELSQEVKKTAKLVLEGEKKGDELAVTVKLENPSEKPITSVQTWFSYDPAKLRGEEINTSASDFILMAPYPNTFDDKRGLVMFGRGTPDSVAKSSIVIGTLTFKILAPGALFLEAYDYREDLTGHTSANTLIENKPYNILLAPENPVLALSTES